MRRGSIFQLVLIGLAGRGDRYRRGGVRPVAARLRPPGRPAGSTSSTGSRRGFRCSSSRSSAAIIVYAMINFRAKPGDMSDGPPVHGNTTIEIIWTIIPAILVTSIAIVSAIVLAKNGNAGTEPARRQGLRTSSSPGRSSTRTSKTYTDPPPAARPARQARDHLEGRDPLLLGATVRPEAGRGPGPVEPARDHARPARHAIRSSAPSSAGSATR